MKHMKLFPKTFLYTLILMLVITFLASGMIYILAPIMYGTNVLSEGTAGVISPVTIPRDEVVTKAVLKSLPFSISVSIIVSLLCAYLFSRAITKPIKHILDKTMLMTSLNKDVDCHIDSNDEIGMLSKSINELYQTLLSSIEFLKREKDNVSEAEKRKVDFLRVASHELKTPITSLNAMLENMIMDVGKYKDYKIYLPLCKERTELLGEMISEILDTSKLDSIIQKEQSQTFDVSLYLKELCAEYQLISQLNGQLFKIKISINLTVFLPPKMFIKAVSNILSNAVAYTSKGKTISVYNVDRQLIIENECLPIPDEHLKHIFEPFYRPDYARNRNNGGNGLGLYIVASILDKLETPYLFCSMKDPIGMRFIIKL